jgi:hypothetical protein
VGNIKMDLREIGCGGMVLIYVAQDRDQWRAVVNTVMRLKVSKNAGKVFNNCSTVSFLRRDQLHEDVYIG